ncbi:MAG TPA: NAD(P)H-hydrate dehydratase [Micavibrio sp.]|jgi:NAD(P)H-hydrate epimerase
MNANTPETWINQFPVPDPDMHKYTRGHLVILGGGRMTGAARLASEAAMRIGAGLCTIMAPDSAANIYKNGAPHILFEPLAELNDFECRFKDPGSAAAIIGPGAGLDDGESLRKLIVNALSLKKPLVLDADALTVFKDRASDLFNALHPDCVLTPHHGEFFRLFGAGKAMTTDGIRDIANQIGANILLKGKETIIASPLGDYAINTHASPYLATAGSGDVLAGMIGGLLAQKMSAFHAACAAAWIHGDAALRYGPGLVAPDIIDQIPAVLRSLETHP